VIKLEICLDVVIVVFLRCCTWQLILKLRDHASYFGSLIQKGKKENNITYLTRRLHSISFDIWYSESKWQDE
jgi:hypothetical protein